MTRNFGDTTLGQAANRRVSSDHPSWHSWPVERVVSHLDASAHGLTAAEAARRLVASGPNELSAGTRPSAWRTLFAQFKSVLITILLVGAVLSGLLGHGVEATAIVVIVVLAVLLGFVQEHRAERALEALGRMAAPRARVRRADGERTLDARAVVPGDVLMLQAGDRVSADARVIESVDLACDEAPLTGESGTVAKSVGPLEPDRAVADRVNLVYAGTLVTRGRGRAVVVGTGMQTEFGRISGLVQSVESRRTPLQRNLDRLGRLLGQAALVVVGAIVAVGIWRGLPVPDMLLFGIALAVAVVPEALPAVVTISLALGVRRMVKRQALVRRLPAVETLGSTSVICTDKTGTLTRNEMTIRGVYAGSTHWQVSGVGYEPAGAFLRDGVEVKPSPLVLELLRGGVLSSDAELLAAADGWHVRGDPTEGAFLAVARKAGLDPVELAEAWPRVREIAFTSERKRMTTLHRDGANRYVAYSKGAVEAVLAGCSHVATGATASPEDGVPSDRPPDVSLDTALLDDPERERLQGVERDLAGRGLRVLAVARRTGLLDEPEEAVEREMTCLGLVALLDPPRAEVPQAVETCRRAGVRAVMMTGDHPLTAEAVAREIGLSPQRRIVTGRELASMSEAELDQAVADIDVYARVSPADKLRIVSAWQRRHEVVAVTGDGVNDAPALKQADVGIAMGLAGTDVSREAAAMTLLDDNFASIVAAVEEGRIVFGNIRKCLSYLLSSNVGEILLIAAATLAGLPLPLTAVQILYVNLATDGLPALALAVDPPEPDVMTRRPRDPRSGVFSRPLVVLLLAGGIWSATVNLTLFRGALLSGRPLDEAMALTFTCLVLIEFFKAYAYRSDRLSVFRRPFANRWLNLAVLWELGVLALVVYLPGLHVPFGTFRFGWSEWMLVLAVAATVIPVLEGFKWAARRGWFGSLG